MKGIFKTLLKDKLAFAGIIILTIIIMIAIFASSIITHDPEEIQRIDGKVARVLPPSREFLLGTTNLGRDIFSQVILGTRVALMVGIISAISITFIGTTIGLVSGYYGGWIDTILMRIVDIMYAIPFIPFVVIMVSLLKPSIWSIILALSLLTWRTTARLIRSQVLSLKERAFIKAVKVAGASDSRIIFFHLLPNVLPIILVEMTFIIGWAIISEASISFIGLGDPSTISWGKILNAAFNVGAIRFAPWWVATPGLAIIILVMSVFFISRGLEQIIDPRLKKH